MSTLARDFRGESPDPRQWDRMAARFWVAWYGRPHGITQDTDTVVEYILHGMEVGPKGLTFHCYYLIGRAAL